MLPPPELFQFDEIEDVLCTVDVCIELAQRIEKQPSYVKWLIIAAHNMLQGAMVCALSGTDGAGALR